MYLKHDNTCTFESAQWNWSRASTNDDELFIASCVNTGAANEVRWPTVPERAQLSTRIPQFPGCIGFIDGNLVEIRRPFDNPLHDNWFNGRKNLYCLNNTVIVDHNGLVIYNGIGYPGKSHDVNTLRHSCQYRDWRAYFEHSGEYFEYLLGHPGYVREEIVEKGTPRGDALFTPWSGVRDCRAAYR
jgi:hypothetical protein